VGRKKGPESRKLRTREHIIADRAVNFVERQALFGDGFVEKFYRDYGYDLFLFTHLPTGEVEGGSVFLQVKATERLHRPRSAPGAAFRLARADLIGWLAEMAAVILIVYEASMDRAYWLHVQGYFAALPGFNLFTAGKTITVYLDEACLFVPASIRQIAELRGRLLRGETT
jgi:hypothetical protein